MVTKIVNTSGKPEHVISEERVSVMGPATVRDATEQITNCSVCGLPAAMTRRGLRIVDLDPAKATKRITKMCWPCAASFDFGPLSRAIDRELEVVVLGPDVQVTTGCEGNTDESTVRNRRVAVVRKHGVAQTPAEVGLRFGGIPVGIPNHRDPRDRQVGGRPVNPGGSHESLLHDRLLQLRSHLVDVVTIALGKLKSLALVNQRARHEDSLTGYGADPISAPTATTEAATSVAGDIVRDGTDKAPAGNFAVEESGATGAAAPSRRPHPTPSTESGSDQR